MRVIGCIWYEHDLRLVGLAIFLCVLACYTTCALLGRAQVASGSLRRAWVVLAAAAFGGDVWSLHFIAMLGYQPGMSMSYDPWLTLLSIAMAVAGALAAFSVRIGGRSRVRVIVAAALLAAAICGMHYTGTLALRMAARIELDRAMVAWSVATCFLLALAAMMAATRLETLGQRALVTALLTASICLLHFTGMSAMTLQLGLGPGSSAEGGLVGSQQMAVLLGTVCTCLLLLSLSLSVMDQILTARATREKTRLRQLASVSFEGLLIERDGIVLDASERFCEMAQRKPAELIGQQSGTLLKRQPQEGGDDIMSALQVLQRGDGSLLPVETLARPINYDDGPATAVAVRDLSARRQAEETMRRLAQRDALTGLANRVLFDSRLTACVASADGGALFWLDLDRFKVVNDLLGHAAGDEFLVEVAARISQCLRPCDTVARLGGDEFAILCPAMTAEADCEAFARRLGARLAEPIAVGGREIASGASIGIVIFPRDGNSAPELLRRADVAMYCSKEEGRGQHRLFTTAMDAQLHNRRVLEQDLRRAIENDELVLFYQPLVDCRSGRLVGREALLRWFHPERGSIAPSDFVAVAEESGSIVALGNWVLRAACRDAASWREKVPVAVNLSPVQFEQGDLVAEIEAALAASGLPPARLEVEMTERVLVESPERAIAALSRLRALGVRVSLDDFGTGYSSLSYLRTFPLDKIKIDRSFITEIGRDRRSSSIVRSIVALAHSLDLEVTAEGVEDHEQVAALRADGCDQIQGYLYGRPAPLEPGPELKLERLDVVEA